MQVVADNIRAWLRLNKPTLNTSKSSTMLVGTRQKLRGESELSISIDDEALSNFNEAPLHVPGTHFKQLIIMG